MLESNTDRTGAALFNYVTTNVKQNPETVFHVYPPTPWGQQACGILLCPSAPPVVLPPGRCMDTPIHAPPPGISVWLPQMADVKTKTHFSLKKASSRTQNDTLKP